MTVLEKLESIQSDCRDVGVAVEDMVIQGSLLPCHHGERKSLIVHVSH